VKTVSSVYETEPVGYKDQAAFLNVVVEIETDEHPPKLLRRLQHIEERVGRTHKVHLQPREIDIDILLYEGLSYRDALVAVPHPEFTERRFVLEPLNEIAPEVKHPVLAKTVSQLLEICPDTSAVVRTDALQFIDANPER